MSKLQDGLSAAVQVWSHHARDKRVRGRGCRDFWLAQHDIDSDLADRQEEQDLTLLRAARKKGRSHAIASRPARRHDGKLSLAGLRDELVLHIACPVQCSFFYWTAFV